MNPSPPPPNPRRRMMVHGLTPARKAPGIAAPPESNTRTAPFLVGHGYDIHRLQKAESGTKLILGGVIVSEELAPIAHSDGDVIFHAIVDALLGATGLGDIGQLFPDSNPRWKSAASTVFLEDAHQRVRQAGFRVCNVDITLLLERPKIASCRTQIVQNIHRLLEGVSVVNLKACTNEGCDAIGRGEAVAAHAVVLLVNGA